MDHTPVRTPLDWKKCDSTNRDLDGSLGKQYSAVKNFYNSWNIIQKEMKYIKAQHKALFNMAKRGGSHRYILNINKLNPTRNDLYVSSNSIGNSIRNES